MLLKDKTVVVTGAGAGLGLAYATAISLAGASVAVNDIDPRAATAAADSINAAGGHAVAVPGSVADWDEAASIVDGCISAFGAIDGFVANAAIMHMTEPWNETEDRLRSIAGVNILGVQFSAGHAMRAMIDAGRPGSIVTIVSGAQHGIRGMSAYGASKGAVAGMTRNWAIEGERFGIRVNSVSPWAMTPMTAAHMEQAGADPAAFPPAAAIAPVVVALLSDELKDITGRSFRFDGAKLGEYVTELRPVRESVAWTPEDVALQIAQIRSEK